MNAVRTSPRVLHVVLAIGQSTAPYNEHCRPHAGEGVGVCTYFPPEIETSHGIAVFPGDGTLVGFLSALRAALATTRFGVLHAHNPHVALVLSLARLTPLGRSFPPLVATVHNSYGNFRPVHRLMWLPAFARFDSVVCCGLESRRSFPRLYRALAGDRLDAIQNGLDLERVDHVIRSASRLRNPHAFTLAAASRLVPIKNLHALIDAFRGVDGASRLIVMGDGPLKESLVRQIAELRLSDRVKLTGMLPREEVYRRIEEADLFVSISRGEGLPVAVLEAMGCRRPVLLSDIPPHREIAAGARFIPLVQCGDVAAITREIQRVRALGPAAREGIGEQCRALVEGRFSLGAMHYQYASLYRELARSRAGDRGAAAAI